MAGLLAGCRSPYAEFYHPEQTGNGTAGFAQPQGAPEVYGYSANADQDERELREKGLVLIGSSSFRYSTWTGNASEGDRDGVIKQARSVGASVVMIKNDGTNPGNQRYPRFRPGQSLGGGSAEAQGSGGKVSGHYREASSSFGKDRANPYRQQIDMYGYRFLATYWARPGRHE
jgi:hypothetical protein